MSDPRRSGPLAGPLAHLPFSLKRALVWSRRRLWLGAAVLVVGGGVTLATLAMSPEDGRLSDLVADSFARTSSAAGLTIEEILVVGRGETSRQALLGALGTGFGEPILALDLQAARQRVLALPWVNGADIERILPDTLIVRLTERQPVALWQHQGKFTLIDVSGQAIVQAPEINPRRLLVVVGDGAPAQTGRLLAMLATEPELQQRINAAVWVGNRRWNLRFADGITVLLPDADPAEAFARLADYQRTHGLLARNVASIDMRFSDRLIVQPRELKDGEKPTDNDA
ncbi:MAG: cell division protein FtsQ/DivIB [Rhodospirillales bacterium]